MSRNEYLKPDNDDIKNEEDVSSSEKKYEITPEKKKIRNLPIGNYRRLSKRSKSKTKSGLKTSREGSSLQNLEEKASIKNDSSIRKSLTAKNIDEEIDEFRAESPEYKSSSKKSQNSSSSKKSELSDDNYAQSQYQSNEVREMIRLLKSQREIIQDYKSKLRFKRKKLESLNNYSAIKVKENELTELKKQLGKLRRERQKVQKGKNDQNKEREFSVLKEQRELKLMKEKQNEQKIEYKNLQKKNKDLDTKINSYQKSILQLTRNLNKNHQKTFKMEKLMNKKNWHEYSDEDVKMYKKRYEEIVGRRKQLKEEHRKEKNYFNGKFESLKKENGNLLKEIQSKEKEIRYNTLRLRKVRKGMLHIKKSHKT